MVSPTMIPQQKKRVLIRQVWASNLDFEFALIQKLLPMYLHVAIDTEFPGFIFVPKEKCHYSKLLPSYNYQIMKINVDALNIIQLGLTLSDYAGNLPDLGTNSCYIWQFNFNNFDFERDLYDPEAIELLQEQGIDFLRNKEEGISSEAFRKLFLSSWFSFNKCPVTWVTFHGGYDFGFLIKILTDAELPSDIFGFHFMVSYFFGQRVYDMKHMMKFCDGLYGGLEKLAKGLNVDRVAGKSHQAGSDSLLTLQTFMKLRDAYFSGKNKANLNVNMFQGVLHGLEVEGVHFAPRVLKDLYVVSFTTAPCKILV